MAPVIKKAVTFKGADLILYTDGRVTDIAGRSFTPCQDVHGYWRIYVKNKSRRTLTLLLHTLFATVFLGYKYRRDYVLFKDGDRHNWALENLEVRTKLQHRKAIGR